MLVLILIKDKIVFFLEYKKKWCIFAPWNRTKEEEKILFVITVADVQHWAEEKLGRRLTYEELQIAKDKLEWGLSEDIDMVYSTIFEEMK